MDKPTKKSFGLKKKKAVPLQIVNEDAQLLNLRDTLLASDHIAELLHCDDDVPMKKVKISLKKKKVKPLRIVKDDLVFYPSDVLIAPDSFHHLFQAGDDRKVKLTPQQMAINNERKLVMIGKRHWKPIKMQRKFLKPAPSPKVWIIPGLRRGPLGYMQMVRLPVFWHKFMQPHSVFKHHAIMPIKTYDDLFLNESRKAPVNFISSTSGLEKPQGNSKPVIALHWTKGERPRVIDYTVYDQNKKDVSFQNRKATQIRIDTETNLGKRTLLYFLFISQLTTQFGKKMSAITKRATGAAYRNARRLLKYYEFKLKHQYIPIVMFGLRRFLRAHVDFVFLLLHTSAHVARWMKRVIKPLTL